MRMMMTGICVLALTLVAHAQEGLYWKQVSSGMENNQLFQGRFRPDTYRVFRLDEDLFGRMMEGRASLNGQQNKFLLSVPNEAGSLDQYLCYHAPVMEAGLAARYPEIMTFAGVGVEDPSLRIFFDYSLRGFHAMILSPGRAAQYIDPVGMHDNLYVVFSRNATTVHQGRFHCLTSDATGPAPALPGIGRGADDGKLRTYRLALACTGEYAQYFLNGSETTDAQRRTKVLAAMNTLMVRTNAIFERDFGIHLNLVANNDAIIYLNASTDPWTTEWNTKTQQTIDAVIGNANYDIGHLVHRESSADNNNGNAGCIGCVCVAGSKGSAFTSHVAPEGDPFVIDYTTHEMGHQFGANHTFTYRTESGTASQFEPGSGSTIMGYAGITGSADVQAHSDDYFHTRSVEQVTNYIKGSTGGSCAVLTVTGNSIPVVVTGNSYTIPHSTPFALSVSASDANTGDVLSYTWEQVNAGTASTTMPATTNTSGPNFRSRNNGTNPVRSFPVLSSILDGTNGNTWEKLPAVNRTLNFRVTVRDNHAGGGANQTGEMTVNVTGTAGPFLVTSPNTAISWQAGSVQTISWSVNGTNATPVSCTNVKISLSVDGGLTFPAILAASTPNDGSEAVAIPNIPTNKARIKVEAVGNIFFDISNTSFTITPAAACGIPGGLTKANITSTGATLSWAAVGSALSYDVMYKPASSSIWISGFSAVTTTAVALTGLSASTVYDWRVRANCSGSGSNYASAQFTTTSASACITAYEPNESRASASAIVPNAPVSAAIQSATDQDYYKLTVLSTSQLNISLSGLPADYDMTVYNGAGTAIGTATTGGLFSESIVLNNQPAGTYYIQVFGYNGVYNTSLCYNLQAVITASTSCSGAYDIASNGTTAGAPGIPFNADISGLVYPSGDIDLYKIIVSNAGSINLALTNLPADYDLQLLNGSGTQVAISQNGGTGNESISYTAAAGTYYARVYGFSSAFHASSCYTLRVQPGTGSKEGAAPLFTSRGLAEIFPNPAHQYLQLHVSGQVDTHAHYGIVDVQGRILLNGRLDKKTQWVDISTLPPGLYLARIFLQGNWYVKPFIRE